MERVGIFLYKVSNVLFSLTITRLFLSMMRSSLLFRKLDDLLYDYPIVGATLGLGGFAAGIIGVLILLLYVILKFNKQQLSALKLRHALLPIFYGISWFIIFLATFPAH